MLPSWLLALALADLPAGVHDLRAADELDLSPLTDALTGVQIVGLGESIHTSGGYADLRADVVRHLIEHEGFRVLAFESPWLPAEAIEVWLHHGEGTPTGRMDSIFNVFDDVSLDDLFLWMRAWNVRHPGDPVHVLGFDIQQPSLDAALLRARAPQDPRAAALRGCRAARHPSDRPRPDPLSHAACLATIEALLRDPKDPWQHLALVSLRAAEQARHAEPAMNAAHEARDAGMAEVLVARLAQEHPRQRAILWAHNDHLATAHERVRGDAWRNLGTHLSMHFGEAYAPIGLVSRQVDVRWPRLVSMAAVRDRPHIAETLLAGFGRSPLWVDLHTFEGFSTDTLWQLGWHWLHPPDHYRGLLYLDHSRANHPTYWRAFTDVPTYERPHWVHDVPEAHGDALADAWAATLQTAGLSCAHVPGPGRRCDGASGRVDLDFAWDAARAVWTAKQTYTRSPWITTLQALGEAHAPVGHVAGTLAVDGTALHLTDGTVALAPERFPSSWFGLRVTATCDLRVTPIPCADVHLSGW